MPLVDTDRAIFEDLDAIVWEADPDTHQFSYVSRKAEEILGYPVDEWLSIRDFWLKVLHPDDRDRAAATFAAAVQDAKNHTCEYRVMSRDERVVWLHDIVEVVTDTSGRTVRLRGVMVDISDRKRLEARSARREGYSRALIEHALDIVTVIDTNGVIQFESPSIRRLLGYEPEELVGTSGFDLIHDDDVARARVAFATGVTAGQPSPFIELRLRHKSGAWRQFEAVGHFITTEDGVPVGIVHSRDITDRKQLEERLRHAQKLEAVGALAAGIAHDFNNLLTAIVGFSQLAMTQLEPSDPSRADVQEVIKAGRSAASLTRQLLAFSRKQILQPQVLDLNMIVRRMESLLRRTIGEDVTFVTTLAPLLGRVNADPGQIEQVIMNLCVNARDAMPDGGTLTIETDTIDRAALGIDDIGRETPSAYVRIRLADTGIGMDATVKAHLFEPFYTTKERSHGTGLGLATVYGIVKQSGGFIHVDSEVGRGTTCDIFLPRVEGAVDAIMPSEEASRSRHGTETILVAEDQPEVLAVARATLTRHGYTVLEGRDADEALEVATRHSGRIDLLITDVVMPGLNGRELADRLAAQRPNTRVLFTSGYTDRAIVERGVLEANVAFIAKPFVPADFLKKVREVLDACPDSGR